MDLDALLSRLHATGHGPHWEAKCPAHEDAHASLSVGTGDDGRILLHCHAGCPPEAIVTACGLTLADLFPGAPKAPRTIAASYDYTDEAGALLFQVVRFVPKDFRQRRPDGNGGWLWNLNGVRRVLYRLPTLKGHDTAFIVEGEKDADTLAGKGIAATTAPGGAGKWRDEYTQQLVTAGVVQVVILPDHDAPGAAHGQQVAASCHAAGLRVKLIALPDLPAHGDVTDWLSSRSKSDLTTLVRSAFAWTPPTPADDEAPIGETLDAFLTRVSTLERVPWLIEHLLPGSGIAMLHGQPRDKKTLAAFECALALTTGTPAFGLPTLTVPQPVRVWYVSDEDPPAETAARFRALLAGRELTTRPPTFLVSIGQGISLDDPTCQARGLAFATQHHVELTILDPVRLLTACADAGPDKLLPFAAFLRYYQKQTGSAVLLIHHDVKPLVGKPDDRSHPQHASGGEIFSIVTAPIHVEGVDEHRSLLTPAGFKFSVSPPPVLIKV
jgi:AAA domain